MLFVAHPKVDLRDHIPRHDREQPLDLVLCERLNVEITQPWLGATEDLVHRPENRLPHRFWGGVELLEEDIGLAHAVEVHGGTLRR